MCRNFIVYIVSLVRPREEEAKNSDDSHILDVETLTALGIVAEMRKMAAGFLKKPQVNDDQEPSVRGEGK